jgi:dethiobiotin synthase
MGECEDSAMKIFITGTDTDVGKTIISAWLCVHLNACYWKPVQSGLERDSDFVRRILNGDEARIIPESYRFDAPVSPHLASKMEDRNIEMSELSLPEINCDSLIVEGAGGILVPLNDESTVIDLLRQLKLPVIIVARSSLGTINHTCLTIEALKNRKLSVLGVIMNGPRNDNNSKAIEKYGGVPVLDEVEKFKSLDYVSFKERVPSKKLIEAIDEFSRVG